MIVNESGLSAHVEDVFILRAWEGVHRVKIIATKVALFRGWDNEGEESICMEQGAHWMYPRTPLGPTVAKKARPTPNW